VVDCHRSAFGRTWRVGRLLACDRNAEFVLNGVRRVLEPELVGEHAVEVGGVVYPVKQVFERASGVPRSQFTSQTALRHLRALASQSLRTPNRRCRVLL
jgi:hypothetical protein